MGMGLGERSGRRSGTPARGGQMSTQGNRYEQGMVFRVFAGTILFLNDTHTHTHTQHTHAHAHFISPSIEGLALKDVPFPCDKRPIPVLSLSRTARVLHQAFHPQKRPGLQRNIYL